MRDKIRNWLQTIKLDQPEQVAIDATILRRRALADNIRHGRALALVVICFELVFALMDISALLTHYADRFHYLDYLVLYSLMILANAAFLILARRRKNPVEWTPGQVRVRENALLAYVSFSMVWGSLISLLDQRLYGQVIVFMVNMIASSIIFIIDRRRLWIPFALSAAVLFTGLPFAQPAADVLIGHYVNMTVFIVISWIAARIHYLSYVRNLATNQELERTISLLTAESAHSRLINDKLSQANLQLRQLSLVDELTGLANRRGLRNFISQVFDQQEHPVTNLAVLMIDIDHFKQYNDTYGHFAGDQVLVSIAGLLEQNAHATLDLAARWGGEEFVLLSFQADEARLVALAEDIRRQAENLGIVHASSPTGHLVTVSIGTSLRSVQVAPDVGPVIEAADMAMYEAKNTGRNRVVHSLPDIAVPAAAAASAPPSTLVPAIRVLPVKTREQAVATAELARRIWTEHYTPIIGAAQVDYMLARFQNPDRIWDDIRFNGYQYDLLAVDGELAGYMAARPDDDGNSCFLSKLYVDRAFRRQGLARLLLDTLIERCKKDGRQRIWLTVNKQNAGSIAAYGKLGFRQADSVVTDIGGGYVMDDYVLELTW